MAIRSRTRSLVGYGLDNALQGLAPQVIKANRAPTTSDTAPQGAIWIWQAQSEAWLNTGIVNGLAQWLAVSTAGGAGNFNSLTVNPGPTLLDGQVTIVAGNNPVHISTTDNVASAISLTTNGGTTETITVTNTQGTSASAITLDAAAGGILIEAALATASAIVLNSTNAAGGVSIDTGTAGLTVDAANGPITLNSGTGTITISGDATAATVDIGTGAGDKTVNVGSTNTTSGLALLAGTSGILIETGTTALTAGNIAVVPSEQIIASPTAAITANTRLIEAIFTGFTTAAAGTQVFTVNSTDILTTSACLAFVSNLDASGNHAKMAITGTIQAAGSLAITCTNNGAGALGAGDNILLTVWILS
jgi:hypothetical protein